MTNLDLIERKQQVDTSLDMNMDKTKSIGYRAGQVIGAKTHESNVYLSEDKPVAPSDGLLLPISSSSLSTPPVNRMPKRIEDYRL